MGVWPISTQGGLADALAAASLAAILAVPGAASAQDGSDRALHIRVTPSGYESSRETLETKVARRQRDIEFKFRLICRGCLSPEAEAALNALPDPSPLPDRRTAGSAIQP